ncbi:MAG: hypothetical protein HZB76_04910 [Chlamydiae bacterium]|nr:hypothetical protein [Chlamydiota bacterium]
MNFIKKNMKGKRFIALICFLILSFLIIIFIRFFIDSEGYHVCIPVKFNSANLPVAKVQIEKKEFYFLVDLGSGIPLSVDHEILKKIVDKESLGIATTINIRGNEYKTQSYFIPRLKIGNLSFGLPRIREICDEDINSRSYGIPLKKTLGIVGRPLLNKVNLLLDFPRSRIIASNQLNKLKKMGFDLSCFTKVPFEKGNAGIIILINTDLGIKRFLIDSGSTSTLISPVFFKGIELFKKKYDMFVFTSLKFLIKDQDFGKNDLCLLNFDAANFDFDGILGMDFLRKHTMYIDFVNKFVYVKKEE